MAKKRRSLLGRKKAVDPHSRQHEFTHIVDEIKSKKEKKDAKVAEQARVRAEVARELDESAFEDNAANRAAFDLRMRRLKQEYEQTAMRRKQAKSTRAQRDYVPDIDVAIDVPRPHATPGGFALNYKTQLLSPERKQKLAGFSRTNSSLLADDGRVEDASRSRSRRRLLEAQNRDKQLQLRSQGSSLTRANAEAAEAAAAEAARAATEAKPAYYVRARFDFAPGEALDMAFSAGDIVTVLREADDGWHYGKNVSKGTQGYFPSNFVQPVDVEEDEAVRKIQAVRRKQQKEKEKEKEKKREREREVGRTRPEARAAPELEEQAAAARKIQAVLRRKVVAQEAARREREQVARLEAKLEAEELSTAATCIQRKVRRTQRGARCARESAAATRIQASARHRQADKQRRRQRSRAAAATRIQTSERQRQACKESRRRVRGRQESAARSIQSSHRRQTKVRTQKRRHQSAAKLQAVHRGRASRARVGCLKTGPGPRGADAIKGGRVKVQCAKGGALSYFARVEAVNADGSCDVRYEADGHVETRVPPSRLALAQEDAKAEVRFAQEPASRASAQRIQRKQTGFFAPKAALSNKAGDDSDCDSDEGESFLPDVNKVDHSIETAKRLSFRGIEEAIQNLQ